MNSPSILCNPAFANSLGAFTAALEAVLARLVLVVCVAIVVSAADVAPCTPANPAGSSVEIALIVGLGHLIKFQD